MFLFVFSMLLPASAPAGAAAEFPSTHWNETPESAGSAERLKTLEQTRSYLSTLATTSLLAERDGRIFFSYGPTSEPSIVDSVRKSILAVLYGNQVEQGLIDIDRSLADIGFDDIGGLLPIEKQATIKDLLTARSGVYHPSSNSNGDDHTFAPVRGSKQPGQYFLYNNWDFNAAGSVFEMLSHRDIFQAFNDDLAKPLQLEDFSLSMHRKTGDATKSRHLNYHFYLSTRDMARIGHLMLNNGNWNGRQLVPADWIRRSTALTTAPVDMHPWATANRNVGYGYLWWLLQKPESSPLHGAYMAWGQYGQFILVIPKEHMVIAHKRYNAASGNSHLRPVTLSEFLLAVKLLIKASEE